LLEDRYIPEPNSGCWLWLGAVSDNGYGSAWDSKNKRVLGAHRYVYESMSGPIPEGHDLDHKCRVRSCVNPNHLEPVTRKENLLRGASFGTFGLPNKIKSHCKRGHQFTPENTKTVVRVRNGMGRTHRECLHCRKLFGQRPRS
jgi:hypothetical protein